MEKLVYIVLVNYNGTEDTLDCVENLQRLFYDNYKVIVVDNASKTDSYKKLKEKLNANCKLIRSEVNLGFAGGNNIGIKAALEEGAEAVLLLNNDTLVEPDFLTHMIKNFEDPKVGIVGSKIKYESRRDAIWFAGGEILWDKFYAKHYGEGEEDNGDYDERKEITFTTGCSMLIHKRVFEAIGLLSEEYFMYFEDVDYCVRASEGHFKIIYEPKAIVYHKVSASTGEEESPFAVQWNTRNRILFMKKYNNRVSKINFIKAKAFFYSTRAIKYMQYLKKGRKDKAEALKIGIKEGRRLK